MSTEKKVPIPARIYNASQGGHVAGAVDIIDDNKNKTQATINAENDATFAVHQNEINGVSRQNYASVNAYSALPSTGSVETIYRVSSWDGNANSGAGAADVTKYSEYAWYNGAYVLMDVKSQIGEVFDISAYNSNTEYADLAAALGTDGDNVPASIRRGGMSVKFVCSSDHKYVQYRLMAQSFSTNEEDWALMEGDLYVDSPEWIRVVTDKDGRILAGIKPDGSVEWSIGVPSPVKEYVDGKLGDFDADDYDDIVTFLGSLIDDDGTLAELLDEKVDKVEGKVLVKEQFVEEGETTEYIRVLTDKDSRIIIGIKADGSVFLGKGVPQQIKDYLEDKIHFDYEGKEIAYYGDSITAQYTFFNNEQIYPFGSLTPYGWEGWQSIVSKYFMFEKCHIRGFGSQGYNWNTGVVGHGGKLAFAREDGTLHSYAQDVGGVIPTLDNYQELGVVVPAGTTPFRGCFCSWNRIATTFPSTMKDDVDTIIIMGSTNDDYMDTEASFISNDTTDPEWAQSTYYNDYGGDYNITTLAGGIASTIMKMQAWMPNATIILATPLSGRGLADGHKVFAPAAEYYKSIIVRNVARCMSIPVIDVNAKCGVNGLNRTSYIYIDNNGTISNDTVHNFNVNGQKALANAIISELKSIINKN